MEIKFALITFHYVHTLSFSNQPGNENGVFNEQVLK